MCLPRIQSNLHITQNITFWGLGDYRLFFKFPVRINRDNFLDTKILQK